MWSSPGCTYGLFLHLDCCSLECLSFHFLWFSLTLNCGMTLATGKFRLAHISFPPKWKFKISQQIFSSSMIQVKKNMWCWFAFCTTLSPLRTDRPTLLYSFFIFLYAFVAFKSIFSWPKANPILVLITDRHLKELWIWQFFLKNAINKLWKHMLCLTSLVKIEKIETILICLDSKFIFLTSFCFANGNLSIRNYI